MDYTKLSISELVGLVGKKRRGSKLILRILADGQLCKSQDQSARQCSERLIELSNWKNYFNGSKCDTEKTSGVNTGFRRDVASDMFCIESDRVVGKIYSESVARISKSEYIICKSVYTKIVGSWVLRLVLERTYTSQKTICSANKVDWDNNDAVYIELLYNKPLSQFTTDDGSDLMTHISTFLPKSGGDTDHGTARDTKTYIVSLINKIVNRPHPFRHLSDIFTSPVLLNRSDYFNDILNMMDKRVYGMGSNYSGIEYIIVIDSNKNSVYYATKSYVTVEAFAGFIGICLMSAVKHKGKYIIRRVIIDNGEYVSDTSIDAINGRNKKFGDLLGKPHITYEALTSKTYQKRIALLAKTTDQKSFIEFTPLDTPFFNSKIYQWTPHQLPIVFLCRACPTGHLSDYPSNSSNQKLHILYLTINARDLASTGLSPLPLHAELFGSTASGSSGGYFSPIQFSPSTFPMAYLFYSNIPDLDKSYVSLVFDYKKREWIFVEKATRADTDTYGDDFKNTELNVWNSYRNPVLLADLILDKSKISDQMYFVNLKNPIHEAPIKMNNFVKNSFIKQGMTSVIDLASGRASDLMNYRYAGVKNLLFCEIDADAVDVALERKYKLPNPNKTILSIFNTDLNAPCKTNLEVIRRDFTKEKSMNVFCFFALHYLTDTPARIKNIVGLVDVVLASGGEFLYTSFSGDSVIKLLAEHKGKWDVSERGVKKYSIVSKYTTSDIKTAKRSIKLILPFNANTFYYDENLINEDMLDAEFAKRGIKVVKEGSFMDFADEFGKKKNQYYNNLTPDDKIFIGLYKYKRYKKN